MPSKLALAVFTSQLLAIKLRSLPSDYIEFGVKLANVSYQPEPCNVYDFISNAVTPEQYRHLNTLMLLTKCLKFVLFNVFSMLTDQLPFPAVP